MCHPSTAPAAKRPVLPPEPGVGTGRGPVLALAHRQHSGGRPSRINWPLGWVQPAANKHQARPLVQSRGPGGRGFGITYNSKLKANPILCASWVWATDLWDFGRAGLRTVRIVSIGAYRCVVEICAGAHPFWGGTFLNSRRARRRGPAWPCAVFY